MTPDAIKQALHASYARDGGINHLDGVNLPSQDTVAELARDFMHVLFPGYFGSSLSHVRPAGAGERVRARGLAGKW